MKQKHRTPALLAACLLLASVVMIFGGCNLLQESKSENTEQNHGENSAVISGAPQQARQYEIVDLKEEYDVSNVAITVSYGFSPGKMEAKGTTYQKLDIEIWASEGEYKECIRSEENVPDFESYQYELVYPENPSDEYPRFPEYVYRHTEEIRIPESFFSSDVGFVEFFIVGTIKKDPLNYANERMETESKDAVTFGIKYEKTGDSVRIIPYYPHDLHDPNNPDGIYHGKGE